MKEEVTPAKSPETMLDEAVERNEQSIRRIQSRIERLKEALDDLEDLQSAFSNRKRRRNARQIAAHPAK